MNYADVQILVVDDEEEVQKIIRRTLERKGFTVDAVGSAQAAREAVAECNYHLLLVDLSLPDDSGIHLIRDLGKGNGSPAVIIITGYPSMSSVTEAMHLRTRNYLTKPISPATLVRAVEEVLTSEGVLIDSEEQFLVELGQRIRSARQGANLTMKTLGDRIGISQAQISQIEAGLSAPSLSTLFRLSKAVQINMSQVFAGL